MRAPSFTVVPRRRLTPPSRLLLAGEILASYAQVRVRMRRAEIRELVEWARSAPARSTTGLAPGSIEEQQVARRLGDAVSRTLHILPMDSRCLVRALVLSRLLSARSIRSSLVIGARPAPAFAAHAWVEHAGRPVLHPESFHSARLLEL